MHPPPITRRTLGLLALSGGAVALAGRATAQDRLSVVAVNYPLAYFAERIAGPMADVVFPVPPGTDPSFWRPGISDVTAIQSADLILLNGAGFADWTTRTTLPRSRIVATSAAFEDAYIATETITHSHGEGGRHSHTGTASYTWLDFGLARQQAGAIAAALRRRRPDDAATFTANLDALSDDLAALADTAAQIGAAAADLPIIASHPRFQYFARAYGLTMEAVEWDPQDPPSQDQWQSLAHRAAQTGARIFMWEATPDDTARILIEGLGMVNTVFPPLAAPPPAGDFISSLRTSLDGLRHAVEVAAQG